MDRELLLEIGVEELPAAWLPGLTKQLSEKLLARLKEMRLTPDDHSRSNTLSTSCSAIAKRSSP